MQHFINGAIAMLVKAGITQGDWNSDNSMVKTWIFNSMEPNMSSSYMFLEQPMIFGKRFLKPSPFSGICLRYNIRKKIREIAQENLGEFYKYHI